MSLFQYVFIPADASKPIETKTGDKSGGLSSDELVNSAKNYFHALDESSQKLANASPDERAQLVAQVRASGQLGQLTDDQIWQFLQAQHGSPTCEIMALTVPTKGNNYQAVSMYTSDKGDGSYNERASQLLAACGHGMPEHLSGNKAGVYGDVFCGRCYDNEGQDDWTRVDFTQADLSPSCDWIQIAKNKGGGGGIGGAKVASLTGSLSKAFSGGAQAENSEESAATDDDSKYQWSQTDDEVEVKIVVPPATKAKQVKINFSRLKLKVTVGAEELIDASTGGTVVVDESTYTLQDEGNGRELCIILTKQDEGVVWAHAVKDA